MKTNKLYTFLIICIFVTPAVICETFGNSNLIEFKAFLLKIFVFLCLLFIFYIFLMQLLASFEWLYSKDKPLFSLKPLYLIYKDKNNDKINLSYKERVIHTLLGFILFLLFFANIYQVLSWYNIQSFNKSLLDFVDAFYFSTATSATVGYGDIYPEIKLAKIIVILQILTTFLYVISILSSLPNILSKLNDKHE